MKKILLSSAFVASFALLVACGDDVTEVNEIHQNGIAVLDAGLELSKQKCDTTNVGEMLFVADSAMVFMCDGGTWVSLKGVDGENGKDGADGKPGEPGADGDDGDDGKNCEVSREGNVLTITCANSTVTVDLDELVQASSSSEEESSSSNVIASSSSAKQSSCSEAVAEVKTAGYYENHCPAGHTCKDAAPSTYLKAGITYGEILDTRDDQVYKVVTIGEGENAQTWMAQNLNYNYNKGTAKSYCYDDDPDNCAKYGRLYTWAAAIDSVALANDADDRHTCGYGETCTLPAVVQGVCPSGWRLPTNAEWDTLFTNVGGQGVAGRMLKSEEGWSYYSESTEGIDSYGFSALPAGISGNNGYFYSAGSNAYFWSSSENDSSYAYLVYLYYDYENAHLSYSNKYIAFSVRCLQNN